MFLKTSSIFLSKAFEFIIAEKILSKKIIYLCNRIKVFSYIVTQILSIGALEILQYQTRSYMIPHSGKVNSSTRIDR